jgi:hypothetical protein
LRSVPSEETKASAFESRDHEKEFFRASRSVIFSGSPLPSGEAR